MGSLLSSSSAFAHQSPRSGKNVDFFLDKRCESFFSSAVYQETALYAQVGTASVRVRVAQCTAALHSWFLFYFLFYLFFKFILTCLFVNVSYVFLTKKKQKTVKLQTLKSKAACFT